MENSGANRPLRSLPSVKKSRFTEEQIVACQRVRDRRQDAGALPQAWHQLGNILRVEVKIGGMEVSDVAKMRSLGDENRRLKRLLADSALEIDALKLIASGNL